MRRRIQILAPRGGFVFNQIHNVLGEVTPENVLAMIHAAHEFGKDPIEAEAPPEELETKYAGYWPEPLKALKEEGVE